MNRQISNVVRLHGIALNRRMVKNANFVKGYSTGDTRRSIRMELKDGGMTAVVKPSTDYSPYLEYGTRFMAAQPFVRPSFDVESQLFIEDLRKLIE
ncbi:HK97-gp10 family putative phage morphogenesis protein [Alkalicoccus luteus]|uniref:HK97 gp10 family phage protein n=1 Tax=Alkalicoccus luteus TaxID=1237094 RepID=A0A969PT68_9BACI|nr:HK97-gp10 family putative phage morphogenesis protein [Alkalicoccus luteus]NJP37921.1 hypothetical protein [Alkalicoccus luteus]